MPQETNTHPRLTSRLYTTNHEQGTKKIIKNTNNHRADLIRYSQTPVQNSDHRSGSGQRTVSLVNHQEPREGLNVLRGTESIPD